MVQVFNDQEGKSGGVAAGESDAGMSDGKEAYTEDDFGDSDGYELKD